MAALWLVIPVHGRPGIARICLEQKVHLVAELAGLGVEAEVLVVGDDENIDTARELGFQVMERPNVLPRKLNDAFEWCSREAGAEFVSFIGSDDWMLPSYMASLPAPNQVRTSQWAAFVAPTGDRLIINAYTGAPGNAPWIVPTGLLEPCGYRPFQPETRKNGMDGSLARSLAAVPDIPPGRSAIRREAWSEFKRERKRLFDHREADELRLVDFKGTQEQLTAWSAVQGRRGRTRNETLDPWGTLATRYPAELVERMQKLYAEGRA